MGRVLAVRYPGCCGAQSLENASGIVVTGTSAGSETFDGHIACFLLIVYAVQQQALEKLHFAACQPGVLSPKYTAGVQRPGSSVRHRGSAPRA
jgi:hypothetical protein